MYIHLSKVSKAFKANVARRKGLSHQSESENAWGQHKLNFNVPSFQPQGFAGHTRVVDKHGRPGDKNKFFKMQHKLK